MLHQKLREARENANLTQEALANLIGVKRAVISKYENGMIEPSVSQLKRIAAALNVSVTYLLEADGDLSPHIYQVFLERLFAELVNIPYGDLMAGSGTDNPYGDLEQQQTISLSRAKEIADELGVTMDYLTGRTEDPSVKTRSLLDDQLSDEVDDADAALIETVHQICGMDKDKITDDYATGTLREVWNPAKINLVREYIQDSKAVLKKMLATAGRDAENQ